MGAFEDMYSPLQPQHRYHIFNRTNSGRKLFYTRKNYLFFLQKYTHYIHPFVSTHAYCLIPNHFHFAVEIKPATDIISAFSHRRGPKKRIYNVWLREVKELIPEIDNSLPRYQFRPLVFLEPFKEFPVYELLLERLACIILSEQFRRMLSGYSLAINKQERLHGSVLQKNYRRRLVTTDAYYASLICYIHRNPEQHGLSSQWKTYPFSSYRHVLSDLEGIVEKKATVSFFGTRQDFLDIHHQYDLTKQEEHHWISVL